MKRLLLAVSIAFLATSVFAFDASKNAVRIGVLQGTFDGESRIGRALIGELRGRGFDAFDARRTYEELLDEEAVPIADYVIEIRGGEPRTMDHGGVGIATAHADVELGIVTSRMDAELRVYDGDTMELVAKNDLKKSSTALMPTGVGIGGGSIFAYIAMPMIERAQHRNVAKKVAREAASFVSATVRGE
jgi:hypothetical protein